MRTWEFRVMTPDAYESSSADETSRIPLRILPICAFAFGIQEAPHATRSRGRHYRGGCLNSQYLNLWQDILAQRAWRYDISIVLEQVC